MFFPGHPFQTSPPSFLTSPQVFNGDLQALLLQVRPQD